MSDLSLQYPIGHAPSPQTLSPSERSAALDILAAFPSRFATAYQDLSEAQLNTPYRAAGWTIRQLIHHVADSHMHAYARMRLAITENWPAISAYDQAAWATLPDSQLPVILSQRILDSVHQRWVTTLHAVPETDWASRGYMHPENGSQTLEQVLSLYAWHSRHHLAHILACRDREGWN